MAKKKNARRTWGKIKKQTNGRFWAGEPLGGGEYRPAPKTFDTYGEAETWLNSRHQQVLEGKIALSAAGNMPFRVFYNQWLEIRRERLEADPPEITPKTYQDYESVGRNYLLPLFGDNIMSKIDVNVVKEFQSKLKERDPKTGKRMVPERPAQKAEQMASYVMNFAVREQAIAVNPFRGERIVRNNKRFHRGLLEVTSDMVELCYRNVEHNPVAVLLAAYVCLRAGEVWGLEVRSVNLFQKRITIAHSLTEVNDRYIADADRARKGVRIGPPKPQRQKILDIPPFLIEPLKQHLQERNGRPDDWLFVDPNGLPVCHTTWYAQFFRPAMEAAKFPESGDFHSLRHFGVSWYLLQGLPPFIVQKMADHTDAEMTRLYSHIIPGAAASYMERATAEYEREREEQRRREAVKNEERKHLILVGGE